MTVPPKSSMKRKTGDMTVPSSKKSVTWSPKVSGVSRKRRRMGVQSREKVPSSVTFVWKEKKSSVEGNLYVKARKSTKNTLIMLQDRSFQLLVDLTSKKILRIYLKKRRWRAAKQGEEMTLSVRLGNFVWMHDENAIHSPGAKGFDLSWMEGKKKLLVKEESRGKKTRNARTTKKTRKRTKGGD